MLVVGAGGLGVPLLQYMAAAGIGSIGIMDDDKVEEINLKWQALYGGRALGKYQQKFRNLTTFFKTLFSNRHNAMHQITKCRHCFKKIIIFVSY